MFLVDKGKQLFKQCIIHKNYFLYRMVKNFYSTNYKKTALVCYIVRPFVKDKTKTLKHSNYQEAELIVKALSSHGFNIDIINYDYKKQINYDKYDLIFGFGNVYEKSFYCEKSMLRIFYATGSDSFFQNYSEIARVKEVTLRKKAKVLPKRISLYTGSMSTLLSDAMIIIGNDFTKSTFSKSNICKYTINATPLKSTIIRSRKINNAKTHFLWFGSAGLIHKGLDLCLEVFSKHEDMVLHICGPQEEDFFNIYDCELKKSNIVYHGFVEVSSDLFEQIVSQCMFTILPSCSEGQATSLLTTMATGLIPIASVQCGIDIDKYGIVIEELSEIGVAVAVDLALQMKEDELAALSDRVSAYVANNHNLESFFNRFDEILKDVIA